MDIRELLNHIRAGSSDRQIARDIEIDRRTVKRYREWAEEQGLLEGTLPSLGDLLTLQNETMPTHQPPQNVSSVEPYREIVTRRLEALYALMTNKKAVVITSLEAASYRILPKEALVRSLEYFEIGEDVDRDHLLRRLEINGYQRVSIAEERGDYSVRGGVIDVFSPLYPLPTRLEFW